MGVFFIIIILFIYYTISSVSEEGNDSTDDFHQLDGDIS